MKKIKIIGIHVRRWNHGLMKKSAEAKIKIFENISKKYSLGGAGNL